jgi:hypothetical protein
MIMQTEADMPVPSMAGGGGIERALAPYSPQIGPRAHTKIVADLELVSKRLKDNRAKIRNSTGALPAKTFNDLTNKISADVKQQDELLGELFEEMCWHNPELLGH